MWTRKKFIFKDSGNDLHKFPLTVGLTIFRFKYAGEWYLTISLHDENDRHIKRVAEPPRTFEDEEEGTIYRYQNHNSENIKKAGVYLLKIKARGSWEIEVEQ